MNKAELKANLEKLLEQLEAEENNAVEYFHSIFGEDHDEWTEKQIKEHDKTMRPLWDAGDNLASAIKSLE